MSLSPNQFPRVLMYLTLLSLCFAAMNSLVRADIINGDFESTTINGSVPDGWVATGFPFAPLAYTGNAFVPPASGVWAVDLGPSGNDNENGGTLSQTFSVSAPGTYVFRFDYSNESHNPTLLADFSWFLAGAVTDSATLMQVGGGYVTFSRSYLVNSPGNITVGFSDIIGNGHGFDAVIDNVSFSAVPEPSSLALIAIASAGLTLRRKTRQA